MTEEDLLGCVSSNGGRRALITGLSGFTGFHLAAELERAGFAVFGVDAHSNRLPNSYQVNLLDKAGLADVVRHVKPTVVVHLAAISFVGHGSADDFYQTNIIGSRNLLEALSNEKQRVECVLLASSANIYGNSSEEVLTEESSPNPANDYAVSKLSMEYMAKLWMERLPIVIVRPFNYTGIGQSLNFLLPKIVDHFRRRASVIELGNLDIARDFSDVRTLVAIYRALLETCPSGEVVNVCSGRTYSLREILTIMERVSSHTISVRVNPDFVRSNDVKILSGSPLKLFKLIGERRALPLEDTLAWMLGARN